MYEIYEINSDEVEILLGSMFILLSHSKIDWSMKIDICNFTNVEGARTRRRRLQRTTADVLYFAGRMR